MSSSLNESEQVLQHPPSRMMGHAWMQIAKSMVDNLYRIGCADLCDQIVEHIQKKQQRQEPH